jgi:tyrosyl-tRNA synthetase
MIIFLRIYMRHVIDILQERGFIEAMTDEEIREITKKPVKLYCGFDPTSDSLHLGNMVAIMGLAWFQKCGHTPYIIVGGATGMIGDPSGKSQERQLLDEQTIKTNLKGITKNFGQILDFENTTCKPVILDNFDWFKNFSMIDFLRDVGKHFRLGPMLAKDSVRARLNSEEGMSYTEFTYQILQSYDFLYLYDQHGVQLQIGGSDQWGNITAGMELVRKLRGASVAGLTFPLLTTSEGKKFGKSEKGAIWLSPEKLSPYEFYQYLFRFSDADVIPLMKMLTFLDISEIKEYERMMTLPDYLPNTAQKRLAEEVTRIVHGEEALNKAQKATEAAAPGSKTALNVDLLEQISGDMPSKNLSRSEVVEQKLVDLVVHVGLQGSKGDARRLIRNGGVYLNNIKVADENISIQESDLIEGRLLLLALGKKNKILIRIT